MPNGERIYGERYQPLEEIGRGGFGAVYRAVDLKLQRDVALKVSNHGEEISDELARRFVSEAKLTAQLNHPNILTVHDFGRETDGSLFLVTELLRGLTLKALLQLGEIPPTHALRLIRQVALGLECAHDAGIVHRDIKPANIFIEWHEEERVKIIDFGVVKDLEGGDETLEGQLIGTPHYMSPEQIQGSREIDGRSDIYSLGVVLFHALSGKPPFDEGGVTAILSGHLYQAIPTLRLPDTSIAHAPLLQSLILRMMARQPAERPARAGQVVGLIDALLRELNFSPQEQRYSLLLQKRLTDPRRPANMPITLDYSEKDFTPGSETVETLVGGPKKALTQEESALALDETYGGDASDPLIVSAGARLKVKSPEASTQQTSPLYIYGEKSRPVDCAGETPAAPQIPIPNTRKDQLESASESKKPDVSLHSAVEADPTPPAEPSPLQKETTPSKNWPHRLLIAALCLGVLWFIFAPMIKEESKPSEPSGLGVDAGENGTQPHGGRERDTKAVVSEATKSTLPAVTGTSPAETDSTKGSTTVSGKGEERSAALPESTPERSASGRKSSPPAVHAEATARPKRERLPPKITRVELSYRGRAQLIYVSDERITFRSQGYNSRGGRASRKPRLRISPKSCRRVLKSAGRDTLRVGNVTARQRCKVRACIGRRCSSALDFQLEPDMF